MTSVAGTPPVFLTAEWRNLVMLNYSIPPRLLEKYLPAGTELDLLEGVHYVSLVGFQFLQTRIKGMRIPFHSDFEEVNLRFYVRRKMGNKIRRGVVFLSEIVPKPLIAFVANNLYHEKYTARKMRCQVYGRTGLTAEYAWKEKNRWNQIRFHTMHEASPVMAGSVEEFITEHNWGYNRINAQRTTEYQVEHAAWKVYRCTDFSVDCDFTLPYGNDFGFLNKATPASVFMAEGSAVKVRSGRKI
jgi:hypothetical protein